MLDERAQNFLATNHAAAMITLRRDGTPHAVRVAVALIDGKLWSSGTQARLRTRHLRSDPRASVFVFDADPRSARFLTLEARVTILEGPDVPEQSLRYFRALQNRPDTVIWMGEERTNEEFFKMMVDDQRLIYEFDVSRAYGTY